MMLPKLRRPLPRPVRASSGWASPRGDRIHAGMDFRARVGTPVYAVLPGVVVTSKDATPDPAGEYVSVLHKSGVLHRYLHLSRRLVMQGDKVAAGQRIGLSGRSGIVSSAPHLHFDLGVRPGHERIYTEAFGTPRGGFPPPRFGFVRLPVEPYVPVDTYAKHVEQSAAKHGIPLHGTTSRRGGGALWLVLAIGAFVATKS